MAEFVTIRHPSLPEAEPGRVTRRAFERIHEPKGWEVVEEGDAPATTASVNSPSISEQIRRATAKAGKTGTGNDGAVTAGDVLSTPSSDVRTELEAGADTPAPTEAPAPGTGIEAPVPAEPPSETEAPAPAANPKPAKRAPRPAADGQEG